MPTESLTDSQRALHGAAAAGDHEGVGRLIRSGTPLDGLDAEGSTALDLASANGRGSTIEVLLCNGAQRAIYLSRPNARKRERDRFHYVRKSDIKVVLERIPAEYRVRLRDVFFTERSRGVRVLGHVRTRGRRDITLCSKLPARLSLTRFLTRNQSPTMFGAQRGCQWPPWAARRFLLYDVLLHELGHLQIVMAHSNNWNRKFASETKAQAFAEYWQRQLWDAPVEHVDPVHNKPSSDELAMLPLWARLDKQQRFVMASLALHAPYRAQMDLEVRFGSLTVPQERFLERLLYQGQATSP